ncbi:hypothetical protein FACS1894130_05180 [Spirochaetia bacterium]|nr:hypothetical protein FACS1894130_05180 [Spirochaetia bacterium]
MRISLGVTNFYQRDSEIFLRELDAATHYPDLSWRWKNDIPLLQGKYQFHRRYKDIEYKDIFELELTFLNDYPDSIPIVKEIGGRIPPDFHRNMDGELCLTTPAELYGIFSKEPTLENYIENLVDPYLFGWLYYQQFKIMPWGERKHGAKGLIESYKELLHIEKDANTIVLLRQIAANTIKQRELCPCGSGIPFRKCHKKQVQRLLINIPQKILIQDCLTIIGEKKHETHHYQ